MDKNPVGEATQGLHPFWSLDAARVARDLASGPAGLREDEATARLAAVGPNQLRARPVGTQLRATLAQLGRCGPPKPSSTVASDASATS